MDRNWNIEPARKQPKTLTPEQKKRRGRIIRAVMAVGIGTYVASRLASTSDHSPSVHIGESYVLKAGLPACKTKEDFDKMMTLHRAGDDTSVNLYLASGVCDLLKKDEKYAVTDASVFMVEVTRYGQSFWTPRDSFAQNVESN